MAEPFLSEIRIMSFNFPPKGWALCSGQLLPINQNQALFSLLGTTYGGDGRVNFALPNLGGRVPLGFGLGSGLSNYNLGASGGVGMGGVDTVTLAVTELPAHNHAIDISGMTATAKCHKDTGNQQSPVGNLPAIDAANASTAYSTSAPDNSMQAGSLAVGGPPTAANAGGGLSHENRQPFLALNYCIALQGIFPSQN